MATQTRLLSPPAQPRGGAFHLDARSRDAGRRGLSRARAALAQTQARIAADRRVEDGAAAGSLDDNPADDNPVDGVAPGDRRPHAARDRCGHPAVAA